MPKICPDKLQSIQVLEGDGKSVGMPVIAKDKIVAIDEEKRSITFELIGGEVTKYFKNFNATLQADTSTIKWSLEYEKASEDEPNPHSHLDFLVNMSREVDAYLLKP
ncbi:hypothetical protein BUALT_Bualt05G0111500 [Buddleja alternifolia]|uniref:Bet v I/Major latex protein domain-containing protein n=1 Tax=Buddleja alternifolia TaxID=168488 RepID=A0AAV6XQ39_9LAMI|nr:hypothetical protein BUALT_Bualt05G0111500 [Buddleja alternifolia]